MSTRDEPITVADMARDSRTSTRTYRVVAIMRGVRFGLDETRGEVGLSFGAYIGDGIGAPQFLDTQRASVVIAAYKVGDVSRLEGKPCWVTVENGRCLFYQPCLI